MGTVWGGYIMEGRGNGGDEGKEIYNNNNNNN
jgi:hypothetical protein